MDHREGESGPVPFRTGRIFNVGVEWYFSTRGGIDRGPYDDKKEAEAELSLFLRNVATEDQHITS